MGARVAARPNKSPSAAGGRRPRGGGSNGPFRSHFRPKPASNGTFSGRFCASAPQTGVVWVARAPEQGKREMFGSFSRKSASNESRFDRPASCGEANETFLRRRSATARQTRAVWVAFAQIRLKREPFGAHFSRELSAGEWFVTVFQEVLLGSRPEPAHGRQSPKPPHSATLESDSACSKTCRARACGPRRSSRPARARASRSRASSLRASA